MTQESDYSLALVIDGKVEMLFNCDAKMASILLSDPIVVDVTEKRDLVNETGLLYDDKTRLFYKRVDLMGQYRNGIRTYPHPDNNYDHYVAAMTKTEQDSSVFNANNLPFELHRDGTTADSSAPKPCGCGK